VIKCAHIGNNLRNILGTWWKHVETHIEHIGNTTIQNTRPTHKGSNSEPLRCILLHHWASLLPLPWKKAAWTHMCQWTIVHMHMWSPWRTCIYCKWQTMQPRADDHCTMMTNLNLLWQSSQWTTTELPRFHLDNPSCKYVHVYFPFTLPM
jgi:hypothetical protein